MAITSHLSDAIEATTQQAGRLQDYLDAMSNYHNAAWMKQKLQAVGDIARKYGTAAVARGAGGGAIAYALKKIFE